MFNKFLGFFKKKENKLEDKAKDLVKSTEEVKDDLLDEGKKKVEEAVGIGREVAKDLVEKKDEAVSSLNDKVEEIRDRLEEKKEEIKENLKTQQNEDENKPSLSEILEEKKEDFIENHPIGEAGLEKQIKPEEKLIDLPMVEPEIEDNEIVFEKQDLLENINVDEEKQKKLGFLERLKTGLLKTRDAVSSSIDNLLNGKATIDDDLYEDLEEIMISADMGVDTTIDMIDRLRETIAEKHIRDPKLIKAELSEIMKDELRGRNIDNHLNLVNGRQAIILVIGVNGVGKTTTIGKLAHNIQKDGKSVILAAADTFRAAAIEQLTEWSNRAGVEIISHAEGADPASVVFDAIAAQKARNKDVLIIDTAGRLHNKKNLMNELEKINRIIDKQHPEASRETLLVLDATTGQNAIFQAKEFNNVTNISGIVLTKLDGTAKGGVVFPLQVEHQIPVKYIGIGEGIDNLEKFDSDKFVEALF